jgi:hypothetical protein
MNKIEAKEFLKRKLNEGYITHSTLLDLYGDTDDIPDNMLELMYSKPKPLRSITFYGSEESTKELDRMFKEIFKINRYT